MTATDASLDLVRDGLDPADLAGAGSLPGAPAEPLTVGEQIAAKKAARRAKAVSAAPRIVPAVAKKPAPPRPVAVKAHARGTPTKRLGPIADRAQQEQKLGLFRRRQGYVGD